MLTPLINAALTLAEMAPVITRWFSGNQKEIGTAHKVGDRLISIAKDVTNLRRSQDRLEALNRDLDGAKSALSRPDQAVWQLDGLLDKDRGKGGVQSSRAARFRVRDPCARGPPGRRRAAR